MKLNRPASLDLSIIMPCRNERATVGICVDDALAFVRRHRLAAEVLVVDNGSTDGSGAIAKAHGAVVVQKQTPGYGRAIRAGIAYSRGRVLIIGDCDTTYDFLHLMPIYAPLAEGSCDVVIGDRFAGGMEKGAMPLSHRLGVPFLSRLGRLRYHVKVHDFHCGLRGLTRDAAQRLKLHTQGMEFATEFIAQAARQQLVIAQTPVALRRCRYERASKLHTVSDGLRHLRYIMRTPA